MPALIALRPVSIPARNWPCKSLFVKGLRLGLGFDTSCPGTRFLWEIIFPAIAARALFWAAKSEPVISSALAVERGEPCRGAHPLGSSALLRNSCCAGVPHTNLAIFSPTNRRHTIAVLWSFVALSTAPEKAPTVAAGRDYECQAPFRTMVRMLLSSTLSSAVSQPQPPGDCRGRGIGGGPGGPAGAPLR